MAKQPKWTTACPDWERRIVAGKSIIPVQPLFKAEAQDALDIFRALRVVDMGSVDDCPTMGDVSRAWVLDFVAAIFGAYNPESGRRLIREFMLLISKKNGKSTDAAGIMMTAFLKNWRQSAEMGILAPTVEVANNAYNPARDMIKADEELSDLLRVQDHIRTITHKQTGATLQVVAADSDTVAGKKWAFTLVDELWLFGKRPNSQKMLLEATGGMASRPEGFVLYLSTQSDEPPAGVFKEKLDYARRVRDGEIDDPEFLPVLYEFPAKMIKDKAYLLEENWHVTNPNLGASVDATYIRRKLREAQEGSGGSLQDVLAKHLNVEIGLGLRADRWKGANLWERHGRTGLTLQELLRRCEVVTVGIDGGGLDDLLGLAVLGRERGTGKWLHWGHAWAHPIALETRKSEESKYADFERAGDLTIIEQLPGDVSAVAEVVREVEDSGLLASIGLDPEKTHKVMLKALLDQDIDESKIIGIPQSWRLIGAITVTERKLAEGELEHGAQPLMAYAVGNAKVEPRGNAALITKAASGSAKIDPLMALFDAAALMALDPEAPQSLDAYLADPILVV